MGVEVRGRLLSGTSALSQLRFFQTRAGTDSSARQARGSLFGNNRCVIGDIDETTEEEAESPLAPPSSDGPDRSVSTDPPGCKWG